MVQDILRSTANLGPARQSGISFQSVALTRGPLITAPGGAGARGRLVVNRSVPGGTPDQINITHNFRSASDGFLTGPHFYPFHHWCFVLSILSFSLSSFPSPSVPTQPHLSSPQFHLPSRTWRHYPILIPDLFPIYLMAGAGKLWTQDWLVFPRV